MIFLLDAPFIEFFSMCSHIFPWFSHIFSMFVAGECPAAPTPRKVYPVLLDLIAAAGRTGHDADLLEHAKECGWEQSQGDEGDS